MRTAQAAREQAELRGEYDEDETPTMTHVYALVYRPLEAHLGWSEGTLRGDLWEIYDPEDEPTAFMEASELFRAPM